MSVIQLATATGLQYGWLRKAVSASGVRRPKKEQLDALELVFGKINWSEIPGEVEDSELEMYRRLVQRHYPFKLLVQALHEEYFPSLETRVKTLCQLLEIRGWDHKAETRITELAVKHQDDRMVLIEYFGELANKVSELEKANSDVCSRNDYLHGEINKLQQKITELKQGDFTHLKNQGEKDDHYEEDPEIAELRNYENRRRQSDLD